VYGLYHDAPRFGETGYMIEACAHVAGCTQVGDPQAADPMHPANRVARTGLRIKQLIVRLECLVSDGGSGCGPVDPPARLILGASRIGLSDESPPVLAPPTGPLVTTGSILDGPEGVTVSAEDAGGGVERFAVIVDGQTVAEQAVGAAHPACRRPYVDPIPCPNATTVTFAFDTGSVANGAHRVQVAAIDAAGNRTLSAPAAVRIANGGAPNGLRASRAAKLVASFAGRQGRGTPADVGAAVAFGGTRAVRGRLTDADGRPIAGARLDVVATVRRPAAREKAEGFAVTGRDGRFRYVPRRGPSRSLRIEYRGFTLDPEPSTTATVTLDVRAGVKLAVRPRRTTSRGTIRFRGRLKGGPGRAGVQVTLYAVGRRTRSRVPVAVLTSDTSGRFRFEYRFVRTFAPFTYRFIARTERQRGYPYAGGSSARVTVRVVR
jgi:hypothetical protein